MPDAKPHLRLSQGFGRSPRHPKGQRVNKRRGQLVAVIVVRSFLTSILDDTMTIQTTKATVSDLKKVKNSVIGNPLAKDGIVRNEELMRR